jgi:hypothetical protein
MKARQTIRLHPNPVADFVQIKGLDVANGETCFTITDAFGRTALSGSVHVSEANPSIHVGSLPGGVYQVVIKQGKELITLRMLKQ